MAQEIMEGKKMEHSDRIQELVKQARAGQTEVLPHLRRYLDENPKVWHYFGDLGRSSQAAWIELIGQKDLLVKESIRRQATETRESLAGPDASPLEKLQADRIVALYVQVSFYEMLVAKSESRTTEKATEVLRKRLQASERAIQQAISGLARIRKLLPQSVKVDVVVSGQLETTLIDQTSAAATTRPDEAAPSPVSIPRNRFAELSALN